MDPTRRDAYGTISKVRHFFQNDKEPCKIEEGLYLGSYGAAGNKSALKSLNITHILTIANSLTPLYPDDFVYKVVKVSDRASVNISEYFEECFEFIDKHKEEDSGGGGVLVHCYQGRSRSVTIVLAYLMHKHGMGLIQAMEHVKNKRPVAAPNIGFVQQLSKLEKARRLHNNNNNNI